ncbi:MAG: 16S rRNA (cytosine(967)-C(5))-methyltransferase RsmB [Acutalibacteraceae bacterium]
MSNPRDIVFKALLRIDIDDAYSNLVIDSLLDDDNLTPMDKKFISALFYGVLERKITLDYIIRQYSTIRLKKIEKEALCILRMGVYQLIFMDKVPQSAAVNESVKLAKKYKLFHASGFINGILRSLARAECKYKLPDKSDLKSYLSVKYSCPQDIVSLWLNSYGEDITVQILQTLCGRPPLTVRVNNIKTTDDALIAKLAENGINGNLHHKNCIMLQNSGSLKHITEFKEGLFHVQDLASQLCCELTGVKSGYTVVDVCAAPGGKSFTMAQIMNNDGKIFAFDLYENRIKLINDGAKRLGISIISSSIRDAKCDKCELKADVVLCDAPCSGLGILRRKPEIRYKEDTGIHTLPSIQYEILINSSKIVKNGGTLIYSTCTLNPAENNEVAKKFLKENKDFVPLELNIPEYVTRKTAEPTNMLTVFPQSDGADGFFISAFKKQV